jgi:hypothetical protein
MIQELDISSPVGEHPIPERHAYTHNNRSLYAFTAVFIAVLIIVSFVTFTRPTNNATATTKAVALETLLKKEGLPLPTSLSEISNSLGTSAAGVCDTSGYNLTDAIFNQQFSVGATAGRTLPVEREVLDGQLAILDTYCPGRVSAFVRHFHAYDLYQLSRP